MQNLLLENAYILHRRPWRESSFILDVFSSQYGRVAVIARGQRNKKKSGLNLEPFQPFRMQLRGNSDLKNLTHVDPVSPAVSMKGSNLFCALYVNELLAKLLAQFDEDAALFTRYENTLSQLAELGVESLSEKQESILRRFELQLFSYCGVDIDPGYDAGGDAIEEKQNYTWLYGQGWMPCLTGSQSQSWSGAFIRQIGQPEHFNDYLPLYKALHRRVVQGLLDGRELTSRQLFS